LAIHPLSRAFLQGEVVMLLVLFAALASFWLVRAFDVSALPSPYGGRANIFAGIATAFCLLDARRRYHWPFAFAFFAFALAFSIAVELIGTMTGHVFGGYHYNANMPGQLFGRVPLVVPLVWFIISYLSFVTAATLLPIRASLLVRTAVATVLLVAYDLVADPNHLYRGGWSYPEGAYYGIPLQNFVAWAALGFISFLLLGLLERREGLSSKRETLVPLAAIAYTGLMFHEGMFALMVAGHRSAAMIAFAVAAVVAGFLCKFLRRSLGASRFLTSSSTH
jgi:putative membrane protein